MYQDPKNFAEPKSFIPERWLGEDERFANDDKAALNPFSYGPRNCLGKKYVNNSLLSLCLCLT
jgi:cytochrome P450